ncbi:uncharacterized protein LOC135942786 isoform X2 [Cloeon dipterum]|uniref:uncharacterized protein LOC135942786 isoform X2 n=1 Tax=Cloeon dipterum TaxID=197152 RepID=UPI00322004EB
MPIFPCLKTSRPSSMEQNHTEEPSADKNEKQELPEKGEMPAEGKVSGYLDKRGRMLPTWKRYWFVLDGPVLLRFQSEEDYKNLSPCQSILNLGRVVTLRPAGSRSSPQIVLVTEANVMYLRAKEQSDQQRWQAALHASIVKYSNAWQPELSNSARRYEDACLPEPQNQPEVLSTMEKVRRMGQQSLVPPDQVLNASKSLRKVSPAVNAGRASPAQDEGVGEIKAKLPTNSAVHRMLERRQEDSKLEMVEMENPTEDGGVKEDGEKAEEKKQETDPISVEVDIRVEEIASSVQLGVEGSKKDDKHMYSQVNKNRKSLHITRDTVQNDNPENNLEEAKNTGMPQETEPQEKNESPQPTTLYESVDTVDEGYDQIKDTYRLEDGYEAITNEEEEEEDIYATPSGEQDMEEDEEDEPLVPPRPQQETFHASPVVVLEADSPEPDYEDTEALFSVQWSEPEPPPRPVDKSVDRTCSVDELDVLLCKGVKTDILNSSTSSVDKQPSTPQVVRAIPCVTGVESREERAEKAAHDWTLDLPDVVPPTEQSDESDKDVPEMSLEEAMQVIRRASRRIPKVSEIEDEMHEAVVVRVHTDDRQILQLDGPAQSKRLSFAKADLELTLEETVDTMKTPFVSSTFG